MSDSIDKLLNIIDDRCNKNLNNKSNNYIKQRIGSVVEYDEDNGITYVIFPEDENQQIHTYYNKTPEVLEEGNQVRVFYTVNIDKGWIGARCGEPVFPTEDTIIPYKSIAFKNNEDTELSEIVSTPLNLNFTVVGNDSDTVLTANQLVDIKSSGVVNTTYKLDEVEMDCKISETVVEGKKTITHIVPISVLEGEHNIKIVQTSSGTGITDANKLFGVISGQLSSIAVDVPPNDSFILKVSAVAGEEIKVVRCNTKGEQGTIYWGDGSSQDYNTNVAYTHTYENDGDYKIVITAPITEMGASSSSLSDLYNSRADIKEVVLPDSLLEITATYSSYGLFSNCTNLTNVKFGSNLQKITDSSFYNTGLTGILTLPRTLQFLGSSAFSKTNINKVVMDCPNLTNISTVPFYGCSNLNTVYYNAPATLSIHESSSLKYITYGDNCKHTGTFWRCNALAEISMSNSITIFDSSAFAYCSNLTTVKLSNSLTYIGTRAFMDCILLNNVIIPSNVTTINAYAFQNCKALSNIYIPSSITTIEDYAFLNSNLSEVTELYLPNLANNGIGQQAFGGCKFVSLNIITNCGYIGKGAFQNCTELTNVVIDGSVQLIGSKLFYNCTKLASATIPYNCQYYSDTFPSGCTVSGGMLIS